MWSHQSLAALGAAMLISCTSSVLVAGDLERSVGASETLVSAIESDVPMSTVKHILVSGYMNSVEEALDHIDSTSDRAMDSLVGQFAGSDYEKAFEDLPAGANREVLKTILLREARLSVEVLETAISNGTREQFKELLARFNASMASHQTQNFSMGDLMRKTGLALGYVIGGGSYVAVHTVKVPVVFTLSLLGSLGYNAAKSGSEGFVKVQGEIYKRWVESALHRKLASLFDFKKLFEEEEESWRKLRERYGRPGDPFEDPPAGRAGN